MYAFDTFIRVRYAETDQMGFVYYGNYATYYEVARVECLRDLGVSYKELEEKGIQLPVLENYSKFIMPARYDDLLTVRVMIKKVPGVKITFNYEIYNPEGELINLGETTLVFINTQTSRPCKPPQALVELLAQYCEQ
jgi:acyl-CoA thioester hydrolase